MKKILLIALVLSVPFLSFAEKEVFSYTCEDIKYLDYDPAHEGFSVDINSLSDAYIDVDKEIIEPLCLASSYGGWLWEETLENLSTKHSVEIYWEKLDNKNAACKMISEKDRDIVISSWNNRESTLFHEIRHAQQPLSFFRNKPGCRYDLLTLLMNTIIREADAQAYGLTMVDIIGIQKFHEHLEYNKWYKKYDDENLFYPRFSNDLIKRSDSEKIINIYLGYFRDLIHDDILFEEPRGNIFRNTDILFERKQLGSISSIYACSEMREVPEILERMQKYEIFKNYNYPLAESQKEQIDITDIVYPVGEIGEYNYFDLNPSVLEDAEKYLYKKIPYYLEKKYNLSWEEIKKTWYFACDIVEGKITAEDLK